MECFVIFVMAWCWFNATESKPQNVAHNIFSELPQNASLLFFRKKINENCNRKILRDNGKLKPNFVKNLQRQFSDFCNIKTILSQKNLGKLKTEPNFVDKCCVEFFSSWKYALRDNPNFALIFIFKFRKYYTVYNSGLKIWLLSGIFWNGAVV